MVIELTLKLNKFIIILNNNAFHSGLKFAFFLFDFFISFYSITSQVYIYLIYSNFKQKYEREKIWSLK